MLFQRKIYWVLSVALMVGCMAQATPPGQYRLYLTGEQLEGDDPKVDWSPVVDAQFDLGAPPTADQTGNWEFVAWPRTFPTGFTIDLGAKTPLAALWIYDTNGSDDLLIKAGEPGDWSEVAVYDCGRFNAWVRIELGVETQYLRLVATGGGANFAQIALDAYSPAGFVAFLEEQAEAERLAAERAEQIRLAREEALQRPIIEMAPYGKLSLVDEVDVAGEGADHMFEELPEGASRVETILGRPARVLNKLENEVPVISYRLGRGKLLRPNGHYVVVIDYPEDKPRSMIVANTGNETIRGFHTGLTVGDALEPKYIQNFCESLDIPLSGQWETWSLLTQLHDRFPERGGLRGPRVRPVTAEEGFTVSISQFAANSIPASAGAAVSRIRLFEVVDPDQLDQPLVLPPEDLPVRRISWREEMSDGVIEGETEEERGLVDPMDWYRHKANLSRFLGINTYTKDLLEFGHNQHWDSRPYGGNNWVFFNHRHAGFWEQIVHIMAEAGLDILPYYEYAGSVGREGLGPQKRARPLTRDDAYTHVGWIERAVADITDPDTYEDFQKILNLTVLQHQHDANFVGIWIRPRRQLPIGFGSATLARFAGEANEGTPITREQLQQDTELYDRYIDWWHGKRRDFLVAMRDYLIEEGLSDPLVMFTGNSAEAGVGFGDLDSWLVSDTPNEWHPLLEGPDAAPVTKEWRLIHPQAVVDRELYWQGLTSPKPNWGDWEWHHSEPANDPWNFQDTEGVLLTHPFNRLHTVLSPDTLSAFTGPSGLALVRHYTLNENMAYDQDDQDRLGYFVADIERAGRFCMHAEVVAMAHSDPTYIGYLVGSNFGRGFPEPVREFNANFLALPALPGTVMESASNDPEVVVRQIDAGEHGTYLAVVHTGLTAKENAELQLPAGEWTRVVTGETLTPADGTVRLDLQAVQLITLHQPR